jgi:hypothetical protein
MATLVCRIQDAEGRGPYRPGFSHRWSEREDGPDPVFVAFPGIMAIAQQKVNKYGGAVGCAFRTLEQAANWFSPSEVLTLAKHGYSLCWMRPDEILAEDDDQMVIWTQTPFAKAVIYTGWRTPEVTA